jgi:outer membrane protein assembly factor BamD (BamD/ComL family)
MVTGRVQPYTMVAIVVLFGLGILTSAVITRRADGQAAVDYEKINRQLEQAMKALDSGDIAAAVRYLEETAQGLPTGEAKTHVSVAIDGLRYVNDTKTAGMHVQLAQSSLQNSTG